MLCVKGHSIFMRTSLVHYLLCVQLVRSLCAVGTSHQVVMCCGWRLIGHVAYVISSLFAVCAVG